MIPISISYGKCDENNYTSSWICKTGVWVTVSKISKEACIERHTKKVMEKASEYQLKRWLAA